MALHPIHLRLGLLQDGSPVFPVSCCSLPISEPKLPTGISTTQSCQHKQALRGGALSSIRPKYPAQCNLASMMKWLTHRSINNALISVFLLFLQFCGVYWTPPNMPCIILLSNLSKDFSSTLVKVQILQLYVSENILMKHILKELYEFLTAIFI